MAVGGAVHWRSDAILRADFSVSEADLVLVVEPSSALVDRGRQISLAIAQCQFCHGADLAGSRVIDDPWIGRLYATNLTGGAGGIGSSYSDADWVRAIRFGLARDGRSLLLMPAEHLSAISDRDLAGVISFLHRIPAVDGMLPPPRLGPLIRLGLVLGLTPDLVSGATVDRAKNRARVVPVEGTAAYGAYLVSIGICRFCHGADMRGGLHSLAQSGEPVPPDLRRMGSMRDWTRENFAQAMREGRTPEGRRLDPKFMPWPGYAGLTNLEIEALWLYLRDLK